MIWYDIKRLEKELTEGTLSDKEEYNYLLANMLLFVVVPYLSSEHYQNHWFTTIQFIADVVIIVLLINATAEINRSGDNKEFLKRFLSLYFVTTIRLLVYLLFLLVPYEIIFSFVLVEKATNKNIEEIVSLLMSIGIAITYYFMLTKSFERVNERMQRHECPEIN